MEIKNTQKENGTQNLTITLSENDYKNKLDTELKKIRKNVRMPGFRPGHVPMSLIKKQYEKAVKAEVVNELLQKALDDFTQKENLQLLGSFIPAENSKKWTFEEKEFQFSFDYTTLPEAKIDLEKLRSIPYYQFVYSDQDVEEEIKNYQQQYAQWKDAEEASGETVEMISVQFPFEEKPVILYPKDFNRKEYAEITKGKKKGDKIPLTLKQMKDWFVLQPEILEKLEEEKTQDNTKFEAEIVSVMKQELPELNRDFFEKILPGKEIEDLETFKKELKEIMNKNGVSQGKNVYLNHLQEKLTEAVEVELPEKFMIRWLKYSSEKEMTDEEAKKQFEELQERFKFEIARTQKLKEKNIKVEDKDIIKAGTDIIARYYMTNPQNFGALPQPEQLYQMTIESLKDKRFANDAYEVAANEKFFEILIEEIGKQPEKISPEKYAETLQEKSKKESEKQKNS